MEDEAPKPPRGRAAAANPANRFERLGYAPDEEADPAERPASRTQFFRDSSRSVIARNDSPDIPFGASLNPYRGCEHGCIYCYARPTHEYLGFSAGLDFESRIMVKEDAPELLRKTLSSPNWKPETIAISGVTDPYQPIERRLRLTRRCLEVLAEFRNPVAVISKNHLISRDADVFSELAAHQAAAAFLSITTLDPDLARIMEPRASHPQRRLEAVSALSKAGVYVGIMVAPVIPGLTDHEMPRILEAAAEAGARSAGYVLLRLPYGVGGLFEDWLERHFPERKQKVLNQLKSMRGGKLYDSTFGKRGRGEGVLAEQIGALFRLARAKAGIPSGGPSLSAGSFRRPPGSQLTLFD